LGAGLVEVPPAPQHDPAAAVLADPEVAEHKRFCGHCDEPVGRRRNGRPSRPDGFCAKCGTRYSFTPKLRAGDLVGGQYDVLGCLAHGGLGWIYLARDRNVSNRWVVLKGLLDTGDAEAASAAIAERRFLAEVEHPNIVRIYNFVEHPDPLDGTMVGYIVMEYVGGDSLKDLRSHRDVGNQLKPLPVEQAIAYVLEVLPALGYLHGIGLLYCDFKPDNVIHSAEQLKLIDLGAVRRIDDLDSAVYKTDGYCAPELSEDGPSIESDLYTVGRTLAVLIANFDYAGVFRSSLPVPSELPILAEYPSLHRFLLRATASDPARRFESAQIMTDQLAGVLREILASRDGQQRPAPSTVFGPERHSFALSGNAPRPGEVAAALPVPQVDATDAAAGFLATSAALPPERLVDVLLGAPQRTQEVRLKLVQALIAVSRLAAAEHELDRLFADDPHDWRIAWYRGICALAEGRLALAFEIFTSAYALVPGEPSVKLALAACHEMADRLPDAERLYRLVWRTDHIYTSAAFGLARTLSAARRRAEAVAVLEEVPSTSSHYVTARLAAVRVRVRNPRLQEVSLRDLVDAANQVIALDIEGARQVEISIEVLKTAHKWVLANGPLPSRLLDCQLTDRGLRSGLEHRYRMLARLADNRTERVRFVEQANEIRPISWV
jgi:serine/threonine-protein kinase PknG